MTGIQFTIILWTWVVSIIGGLYLAGQHYKTYKGELPLFIVYPIIVNLIYITILALIIG